MALAERIETTIAPLREAYEGLSDREKRLVTALGGVIATIAVILPMYFELDAIAELERENRAIVDVLHELDTQSVALRQRIADREAAERRYRTPAPPLGSFIEQQATRQGLSLREVTDEPDLIMGNFVRRRVRAQLPGVELGTMLRVLESIENSGHPVAIDRLEVEKIGDGQSYNFRIGISAYDRETPRPPGRGAARGEN